MEQITKIIDADGTESYQVTETVENTRTVRVSDLDNQITNLQQQLDMLQTQKDALARPDKTVDLRPNNQGV